MPPEYFLGASLLTHLLPLLAAAMDFLKSAVASAIAKGPAFPYTFGDKVDIDESIWTLYNGTKRVWRPVPHRVARSHC